MGDHIKDILTLAALDELTSTHKYVIIDFTAQWCPPCKAIAPLFHKLAAEYARPGALAFARVDVDEASEVAAKFGISAMPTFLFLVDGVADGFDDGGALTGAAVQRTDDRALSIRGADPKNLVSAAIKLSELAAKELVAEEVTAESA
ncbi:hypothetical protein MYCTH_2303313 [Thermothelomyces thermophilus ATCC 42464]|uniref:Thioredoxin domain-containing protein n=1 Tax=Thermothelomyces thermophilus (strain ATCC 42464 / BCRC 31852 / DSM 1799) TaxID=573729 RepID=G2QCD6_THET4|nr:uncharacterized protein MYCTH_2303313 [Thermothelomyces thermophilus ATCC 42464]AEO57311.1 hypothetical protein MYCTH_2303313 [Thermothelomyces thermophilus ATCC 42464]